MEEQAQQTLVFDKEQEITKSWQTVGTLEDDDGNTYRVFVSGSRKTAVQDFMRRIENGEINIRVKAEPLEEEVTQSESYTRPPIVTDPQATGVIAGDISVGISRLNFTPPAQRYRIRYEIDPMINKPQDARDRFEATFDDQNVADVLCEVSQGSVRVELREINAQGGDAQSQSKNANTNQSALFRVQKIDLGNWAVRVTGLEDNSKFALRYDKEVPF